MGASVPASHIIFMVAAIIAATAVGAAMISIAFNLSEDIVENSEGLSEVMQTDIKLVNDPVAVPYSGGQLDVYVLNSGDTVLDGSEWIVLIDGVLIEDASVELQEESLDPGEVGTLQVTASITSGDNQIKVMYGNKADDSMRFRI